MPLEVGDVFILCLVMRRIQSSPSLEQYGGFTQLHIILGFGFSISSQLFG